MKMRHRLAAVLTAAGIISGGTVMAAQDASAGKISTWATYCGVTVNAYSNGADIGWFCPDRRGTYWTLTLRITTPSGTAVWTDTSPFRGFGFNDTTHTSLVIPYGSAASFTEHGEIGGSPDINESRSFHTV